MKNESKQTNDSGHSGTVLMVKLFLCLIVAPILLPIGALFIQALTWRYLLSRIDGIDFAGALPEAFALSLALVGFAVVSNWLVSQLTNWVKKLCQLPVAKPAKRKVEEIASWEDFQKLLPGPLAIVKEVTLFMLGLALATALEPARLHFDGILQMLLAAAVLSAMWTASFAAITAALYAVLMREQRVKEERRKAAEKQA